MRITKRQLKQIIKETIMDDMTGMDLDYDEMRTEEDRKVLEIISDWEATNPKINLFYSNEGIKQAYRRASGPGHSRPHEYETQRKVMLRRAKEGRAKLEAALDALDAFEAKYLGG